MLNKILLLLSFLMLSSLNTSQAEMRPIAKLRAGIPPFEVLEKILKTNNTAQSAAKNTTSSAPWITWLADADYRMQPQQVLTTPQKKIFAVRNLGNQLVVSLAMVDYGIRFLHTPVLLITASNDNRAIKFFLADHGDLPLEISRDIDHLRLALAHKQQEKTASKQPVELINFIEANIDYQVEQAISRYRDRLKNGRLVIVGAVFDLDDKYGRGKNRLIVININGEKDGTKLRKARMCRKLDGRLLNFVGRQKKKK